MDRKHFPGLSVAAFQASTDRAALEALQHVPLLPLVIQKYHELLIDRYMYALNMANSVRCGPRQMATVYAIMVECCKILDVPEPELYVTNNPFPNAFAGGVERPYITLRNSVIECMTDEQLYHLVGHELGHIKAGHVLYKSVAGILIPLLQMLGHYTLGVGDLVGIGLALAFYEWSRQAELTCDRAGLLCTQAFRVSADAELRLTGGNTRHVEELNTDAFLDQARTYQDMNLMDSLGKFLVFYLYGMASTHPMPVMRLQDLERWYQGGDFDKIMRGDYAGAPATV